MAASGWDFSARTDVDASTCTQGTYEHRSKVCAESGLWDKNPLSRRGLELVSVLRLAFRTDALPTQVSRPLLVHPATVE